MLFRLRDLGYSRQTTHAALKSFFKNAPAPAPGTPAPPARVNASAAKGQQLRDRVPICPRHSSKSLSSIFTFLLLVSLIVGVVVRVTCQVAACLAAGLDVAAIRKLLPTEGFSRSAVFRHLPADSVRGRKRTVAEVEADRLP